MNTNTLSEWQTKRIGRFTASQIYKLFTEPKTKADKEAGIWSETARSYIFELAVQEFCGYKKELSAPALEHGLVNEAEAFESFVKISGLPFQLVSNQFFEYNEYSGASPDGVLFNDELDIIAVADVKCPFNPVSYFEQRLELYGQPLPKSYFYQLQMQMLCTGAKKGYLVRYLTSSHTDQYGNKFEFDIPLEKRIFYSEVDADERVQGEIHEKIMRAQITKEGFINSFNN